MLRSGFEHVFPSEIFDMAHKMAIPLFIAALTVAAITMPTVHAGGGCVLPDCERELRREDDGTCGMACLQASVGGPVEGKPWV